MITLFKYRNCALGTIHQCPNYARFAQIDHREFPDASPTSIPLRSGNRLVGKRQPHDGLEKPELESLLFGVGGEVDEEKLLIESAIVKQHSPRPFIEARQSELMFELARRGRFGGPEIAHQSE